MANIKKVAIIGASGNAGAPVLTALLDSSFEVTAITRPESKATFPASVTVKRVDITSVDALTSALEGQDAVVSTLASVAIGVDKTIIDAALTAHVKRYIPSEFGANTREARGTKLGGILKSKIENIDYLIELSEKHDWFTWTGLSTGSFFDWSFRAGILGIDIKNKTARIYDSGNEPYSASTLSFIGKSVVAILKKPAETANKYLTVASITATQREILKILEEETGSQFQTTTVKTSDLENIADEKVAKGDGSAYVEYVIQWVFADGAGHAVKENAAKLLGLEEEDLREEIKKVLRGL
ncbi:hypothetical protein G7Y89_g7926 [Cudoniella acicularis]|uniref:NmrA-like domain-containing protein n=1 Tax=Cudoniella acicularis TaxID=354080 RepID=A0A8H4RIE4_9HELO|nr:hypothetical protein G7Y89_g7926 [Cudoniella acicularis]